MKKVVVHKPGGYERLCVEEYPDPIVEDGHLVVDVVAAGINFADCLTRMGLYSSARHYVGYPITPGFELAGHVGQLGAGVTGFRVGDPVMVLTRFGAYAERIRTRPEYVFSLPKGYSLLQAGGFPVVFLTAWFALFELARPRAGDRILVHSAAGGVGSALIQLAKVAGCRVVGVVGGADKVEHVRRLGADAVIDKTSQDLWAEAERLAPDGFQVVLDANGVSTLKESYRRLAPGGKLVIYGFHSMIPRGRGRASRIRLLWDYWRTPKFNPFQLVNRNRSVLGFNLSYLSDRTDLLAEAMRQLLAWTEAGRLQPLPLTAYPFDRVADAHRALETGRTRGKTVLFFEGANG